MDIKGKNVFVTGSSRGIGLGIAHAFAEAGCHVVLNGRNPISTDILETFSTYEGKAIAICGDISDGKVAKDMVLEAAEILGSIDILVNNAGITRDTIAMRMSQEDFETVLKVNLTGTFNMTQAVLKMMTKARCGAIINLASVVGMVGNIGQSNYAASKAGIIGMTKSIAREVASRGVTVNAIAPGFILSDMTNDLPDKIKELAMTQIPMKRFGNVSDVAEVAVFLARQEYMTGQVLTVDGGMTM